jgi:hypothetical protein
MFPHLDVGDLLTAVLSAGLLTVAIVYVARSRRTATDLETPLSQAFGADWSPSTGEMFSTVVRSGGSPGLGLLASAGLHLLVLFGTPMIPYLFPEELRVDMRKYRLRIVEFRVPQPLLYSSPNQPRPQRPGPKARVVASDRARARAAEAGSRSIAAGTARPKFQIPELAKPKARDVVIQPDQPPEVSMTPPRPLPRTFLWAQAPAPPEESRTVGAQRAVPPRPFSLPEAVPEVRRPNRELAISDLQVGDGPVLTFRPPNLPAANVSPVSVPVADQPRRGELPATVLPEGNPMNLIALMRQVAPPAPAYLVGLGNVLPENGAPGAGGAGGTDTNSETNPTGPAAGASRGTHSDLLASAPNSPSPSKPGAQAAPPAVPDRPVPDGRLGIIIVQQSPAESGLEGGEALTGQPVYTVYLDVPGFSRRWILQYCVPGSQAGDGFVQPGADRIQVVPRRSVQPPYPIDRIPVDTSGVQGGPRRLVVYGLIGERGLVENVRLVRGTGTPVDMAAVQALQQWTFRPALRGAVPVAVEALFGIPLRD